MSSPRTYYGSTVAIITPMHDDGSVDYPALENLIDFHVDAGTTAIASVGTTGESATVAVPEHIHVIEHTINYAAGRIPVIAGTGANSTSEAIELTREARRIGADACLLVTPYYNKPTQEGLYQHHKLIAESVDIAQLLYNVPGRTAINMSVDTTVRLSEIDNIIGIKDATGDLSVIKELVARCPKDFLLLTGDDATAVEFILLGGHGGISVSANVVPAELQRVYLLAMASKADEARALNETISVLHDHLFLESNPIPVKWALHKMGKCGEGIRLPLTVLSKEYQVILGKDLQKLNLL